MNLIIEKCGGPVNGNRVELDMQGFCPVVGCEKDCFWSRLRWAKKNNIPVKYCFQNTLFENGCLAKGCDQAECIWRKPVGSV